MNCFFIIMYHYYPFINVMSISGRAHKYSTVGERVPIWRRNKLLNTRATSFLAYNNQNQIIHKHNIIMNGQFTPRSGTPAQ